MVQQMYQRKIFKLHSKEIIKSKMDYHITPLAASKNNLIITLADSQVLRWIDELKGIDRNKNKLIYENSLIEIKKLKKEKDSAKNRNKIKSLYRNMDDIQFVPEYLAVIMDHPSHINKLSDGFKVNDMTFYRLVGTPNGVKKSTVIYSPLKSELNRRMENSRDVKIPIVPAKFEAYKALCCSASVPVTNTHRVLVVDDLETHFVEDYIELRDGENGGEPIMEYKTGELKLTATDGCGMISPTMAQQWSEDLGLDYLMSGCCVRNSFCKGMLATFDFVEFADEFAKSYIVKDIWGHEHDIREIDIILTASMLKLWNSYKSIKDYFNCCDQNGYTFAVTKATPKTPDEQRTLNYQYIQSYELTDEQIWELIKPTVEEIKDILGGDINKTILYLRGTNVTEDNIKLDTNDYVKALMIDERMINDNYVIDKINNLIAKKIKDAKIGVVKVNGNYTIVVGDVFALCQKIFELDVKNEDYGLLKAGEIYHKFWQDKDVDEVVCLRSPMSVHNNIKKQNIANRDDINYWYRYMTNLIVFNAHDSLCHACSGMDADGDILFTTNNKCMIENFKKTPVINCVQKTAEKKVLDDSEKTEQILLESNKLGFGDEIGKVTNRITSMFDMVCKFEPGSKEYDTLMYRIMASQKIAQDAIDKVKGIIIYEMPKYWYVINDNPENEVDEFNNSICVDRKPIFMSYIYPNLRKDYNQFIKTQSRGLRRVRDIEYREEYYSANNPVSDNNCTMNRLCHMVENAFSDYKKTIAAKEFDPSILKSSTNYDKSKFNKVYMSFNELYKKYGNSKRENIYNDLNSDERTLDESVLNEIDLIKDEFKKKCLEICSNEDELCNILIDICYSSKNRKSFVWEMCGDQIITNLLEKNNHRVKYLTQDNNGDIEYHGLYFAEKYIELESFTP